MNIPVEPLSENGTAGRGGDIHTNAIKLIPARKVPPVAHLFDTVAPRLGQHAAHVARSQHLEVRRAHATGSVRAHHDVVELVEGIGGRRRAARLGGWMGGGGSGEKERGRGDGVGAGAWCARLHL